MRRELTIRIALFFIGAVALISIALYTSNSYYSYSRPPVGGSLSQSVRLIALPVVLAIFMALNFFYFYHQTVKTHPLIARGLPMSFAIVLTLCYLAYEFFFEYRISSEGVDLIFLLAVGAWLILNIIVHFAFRKRSALP